ncbi:MAG: hypothetical protein ACREJO_18200 [Phycisphaerales bacterium]
MHSTEDGVGATVEEYVLCEWAYNRVFKHAHDINQGRLIGHLTEPLKADRGKVIWRNLGTDRVRKCLEANGPRNIFWNELKCADLSEQIDAIKWGYLHQN